MAVDVTESTGRGRKVIFSASILKKLGVDVWIYTPRIDSHLKGKFKVVNIKPYPEKYERGILKNIIFELKLLFRYFRSIFIDILKRKYNLVQIHGVTRGAPQLLALVGAKLIKSKVIYYYHDLHPETFVSLRKKPPRGFAYWLVRLFEKIMVENSDMIIVVSDAQALILGHRVRNTNIRVIYPPVNVDEFKDCDRYLRYLENEYGFSRDIPTIVYLGGLEPYIRGLELMVEAMNIVVNKHKMNVRLLLVGDGPLRSTLEKMIRGYNLQNHIVILGRRPHKEAIKILCSSDVAIIAAPKTIELETLMPTKMVEYMAAGKIIIAPKLLQPRIILGEYAVYFEAGDYEDLAEKIMCVVKNLNHLKANASKIVSIAHRISIESMKKKLAKIYRSLLGI